MNFKSKQVAALRDRRVWTINDIVSAQPVREVPEHIRHFYRDLPATLMGMMKERVRQ